MSSQEEEPMDAVKQFAEALRSKGGIENRGGVLQAERYELFRGKDLVRWVKAHPDKCTAAAAGKGGEGPEELARHLGQQLLRRRLALRVDRQTKKPLPGTKKLVKFPRKLAPLPPAEATTFAEDGFYIWLYQRPTSPWVYVWAALIPVVVVGACLFPLAPNWVKIGVFYLTAGLLCLILATLALRSALALSSWLLTGRTLWLLPNVLSEDVPISQILKPLMSVQQPAESSKWGSHPLTRVAVGALAAGFLFMLYRQSPDKASVAKEVGRYKDDLMDLFGVQRAGYERLEGNATAAPPPLNATDAAAAGDEAAGAAAGEGGEAAEAAGDAAAEGGEVEAEAAANDAVDAEGEL